MKGIFYIHYNAPGDNDGAWVFGADGTIDTAFSGLAVGDTYQGGILKYAAKWMDVVTTADGTQKLTGQQESTLGSAYSDPGPIYKNQTLSGNGSPDDPLILASQGATNGQVLKWNSTLLVWEPATDTAGTGDVVGPASSTDEAIARYNLATGKLIQNSTVTITDAGAVAGVTSLAMTAAITGATAGTFTGTVQANAIASTTSLTGATLTVNGNLVTVSGAATISGTNTGDQTLKSNVTFGFDGTGTGATNYAPLSLGTNTGASDPSDAANISKESAIFGAGTLRNFRVRAATGAGPGAGENYVLTIMKNGAAQSLTVTITDPAISGSDLVNTVTLTAGDSASVRGVSSAGAGNVEYACVCEFDAS